MRSERLLELCRVSRPSPQGPLDVTASVGMVQWNEQTPDASGAELLRTAERAMHGEPPADERQPIRAAS